MKGSLTEGPITKSMLLFAFPMMVGNLLQQCYNIAGGDLYFADPLPAFCQRGFAEKGKISRLSTDFFTGTGCNFRLVNTMEMRYNIRRQSKHGSAVSRTRRAL